MSKEVIIVRGKSEGNVSTILAGVHGNEIPGIEAFKKILPNLTIERGLVYFIFANPKAIQENKRCVEVNLNRMFKTEISDSDKLKYEYKRSRFIKEYLDISTALLDLHASFTPESVPFIICENNAKEIIDYLPYNLVVTGFDAIQPGGTDYYMNSTGKIGICVECGYLADPDAVLVAEKSIMSFLKARNHIANDEAVKPQNYIRMNTMYITKTDSFVLSKQFADFEEVYVGQIIGIDGDEKIIAKNNNIILFAQNVYQTGSEAFLLGKKKNNLT